ncbi:MAG TPA: hypothetical protein DD490_08605 [Acidobacteria bacterium]|nr:hypothetical protein [Acidobacteriota bacterium]
MLTWKGRCHEPPDRDSSLATRRARRRSRSSGGPSRAGRAPGHRQLRGGGLHARRGQRSVPLDLPKCLQPAEGPARRRELRGAGRADRRAGGPHRGTR